MESNFLSSELIFSLGITATPQQTPFQWHIHSVHVIIPHSGCAQHQVQGEQRLPSVAGRSTNYSKTHLLRSFPHLQSLF